MKKGRHRRYEEARALKHTSDDFDVMFEENEDPCVECGAIPGEECRLVKVGAKPWCEYRDTPSADSADELFPS